MQFMREDDTRFWFYNSMHFPEPMSAFDMVTAEAAYCALGAANTRVHCLPTTLGIDHRIINGRVYIGGMAVTDPAEIARRTEEFQQRAFYYYENWERLYAQWKDKMLALIARRAGAAQAVSCPNSSRSSTCTPDAASPPTTICSRSTRRRSRATSGCGTTTSSSCCSATART